VDLDEIMYGGDGIEYCLLQDYAGKVGVLVLPRTSCFINITAPAACIIVIRVIMIRQPALLRRLSL
jgi:hypothetical protein